MEAQPKDFISCLAARDDSWVGVDCIRVLVFFVFMMMMVVERRGMYEQEDTMLEM